MNLRTGGIALVAAAAGSSALGQLAFTTEYGIEFSTIGDVGNRDSLPHEGNPIFADVHTPVGGVDSAYRMSRTEVTTTQYLEFAQAYYPIYVQNTGDPTPSSDFTGGLLRPVAGTMQISPLASPNQAARMSWEFAARYVNWLHNDRRTDEAAFEAGVYDTSTFTENPDGTFNHQIAHDPGAKFWIPTRDEWIKAGYWDPNKDGEGGYWLYPNGSDAESIPGLLPEDGGQRNAGQGDAFPLDVGSFVDVQSPWGLFDMAGGEREWTEGLSLSRPQNNRRLVYGTSDNNISYLDPFFPADIIGSGSITNIYSSSIGLRIAASVPAPSAFLPLVMLALSGVQWRCHRDGC